ncbi:MAG: SWIM zinc finger family protein [Acidobacteria bacterium]|nr:SWIM zinc finger family protein [Acidobacteriota bacterium]
MAHWYPRYVPVGVRRARALSERVSLRARGVEVQPVDIRGRVIARSFWGRRWCEHLESFSDFANRLPRGRTYVRNGAVYHLAIAPGEVEARVAGSDLYRVTVRIRTLGRPAWKAIKAACAGQIGTVLELLQGRLSDRVMEVVTDRDTGLFPKPGEMELACDCPDWATMCKHVAAVLYGVGSRLDGSPELLFRLRGVDEAELIAADLTLPGGTATADSLADEDLGSIFGIDLDAEPAAPTSSATPRESPAPAPNPTPPRAAPNATPPQTAAPTGSQIAALRAWCGFSVVEFARLLQVSAATVRRWESVPGPLALRSRTREALTVLRRETGDPEP